MNYLAHTLLANESDETLIGGLLGDFVKGRLNDNYAPALRAGIELHRAIDRYTDTHAVVRASRALVSEQRRRFAGIMVDVFYDHFLVRHWQRYSAVPLRDFTRRVYQVLDQHHDALPERLQRVLPRMSRDDWLASYGELTAVDAALNGIARRFRRSWRARGLTQAALELEKNYTRLEEHFLTFFPQLSRFADAARHELRVGRCPPHFEHGSCLQFKTNITDTPAS